MASSSCPGHQALVPMTLYLLVPGTANPALPRHHNIAMLEMTLLAGPLVWPASRPMSAVPPPAFVVSWRIGVCHVGLGWLLTTFNPDRHLLWPQDSPAPFSGTWPCLATTEADAAKKLVAVGARVGGFFPTLWRMEGGHCVCLFVFGLHRLLW